MQKLRYVQSQLKGESFDLTKSLETTALNCTSAFSLIRERFDHHRRIVYRHIKALLNIKYTNPKSFINTVDRHIHSLDSLNISLQDSHVLLIPLLVSNLEPKLSREWEIKTATLPRTGLPSYAEFRSFMLLQLETHIINNSKETSKHFSTNTSPNFKSRTNSYASLTVTCFVCRDGHFIYQCNQFLKQDPLTRMKTVKSLTLCTNCLRKDHFLRDCKASKCKTRENSHNTLLHHDTQTLQNNSQEASSPQISLQTTNKCSTKTTGPLANFVTYSGSL